MKTLNDIQVGGMFRQAASCCFYVLLFCASLADPANASECPSLPSVPEPSEADLQYQQSWKGVASPYSLNDWMGGHDLAPLGRGHLLVINGDEYYYDWMTRIKLPLWNKPGEDFYGWTHSGLVTPENDIFAFALTGAGMVETGYEHLTFTVLESTEDGWFRLQLKPGKAGSKWTHRCHLQLGEARLQFEDWEEFILQNGESLHFRDKVTHVLRSEPGTQSKMLTRISLDHKLNLLVIKGDWMRVRVHQPSWSCEDADKEFTGSTHVGWVKWKDELLGPWVWINSGGC